MAPLVGRGVVVSAQLALSFPAEYVGKLAWERQLEAIRTAVKHLGPKEVAFTLDVAATQLHDALNERDRKHWYAHWTHVLKAMLLAKQDETSAEILRAITEEDVNTAGFALIESEPISAEEEAAALKRELAKFGDAGKQAIDRVKRRGGRR